MVAIVLNRLPLPFTHGTGGWSQDVIREGIGHFSEQGHDLEIILVYDNGRNAEHSANVANLG